MSLRLILFIIAVLVIAWIIWDHNRKSKKQNYYIPNKRSDIEPRAMPVSRSIEYDIDNEVLTSTDHTSVSHKIPNRVSGQMSEQGAQGKFAQNRDSMEPDFDEYFAASSQSFQSRAVEQVSRQKDLSDIDVDMDFTTLEAKQKTSDSNRVRYNDNPFLDSDIKFDDSEFDSIHAGSIGKNSNIDDLYQSTDPLLAEHQEQNYAFNSAQAQPVEIENKVFTLYVYAGDKNNFRGDELLHGLLSVGCRFGDMNIFHRHEKTSGHGRIMFSVASMVNPGVFDINNMQDQKVPGVALFFTYPGTYAPSVVFDLMLKTAYKLAKHLHGEILDEDRRPLTPGKTHEIRDKIELLEVNEFF